MRLLTAITRPENLDAIKHAFSEAGFGGMTVTEVKGYGKQKGMVETYRGSDYVVDLLDKIKIEVLLRNEDVQRAIDLIVEHAHTGQVGDGKIFVTAVDSVVRIRTKEQDFEAI
ncbi:MAG: P-II family nitrogen regulator [Gammaproteobacteria bacterium]|nr:P-II family nitrogen regulator [Pseudomonadota bacterium]MCH9662349.1 P-II family nitrogen regulator [Gammaproteobacteria bacterium]